MKRFLLLFLLFLLVYSCAPLSKESYLEDYKDFMQNISKHHEKFSVEDWRQADENFKKYSEDWYNDFKDDLTWDEKLILMKYKIQYNIFRYGDQAKDIIEFFKGNTEQMKQQIQYYKEHNMDGDIQKLIEEADDLGKTATKTLDEILKELDIDPTQYKTK